MGLRQAEDDHPAHAVTEYDDRTVLRHGRVHDRLHVTAHGLQRVVAAYRVAAPAVPTLVEQDHAVLLRELLPLVMPRGHVDAEPVGEEQRRPVRVAGGPNVDERAVVGNDRSDLLGGKLVEPLAGFEVRAAPLAPGNQLAGGDGRAHGRGRAGRPQCATAVHVE
jgi:hypothetical protein